MPYLLAVLVVLSFAAIRHTVPLSPGGSANIPRALVVPNDNREAGNRPGARGEQVLSLTTMAAEWQPEGANTTKLNVWAFAGDDGVPRVPGPMLRVTAGTRVRVLVRNTLRDTLVLHGLTWATRAELPELRIAPNATAETSFTADVAGSHHYWAAAAGVEFDGRQWIDGQLSGALVVDGPSTKQNDRVFVITESFRLNGPEVISQLAVNGLSWPNTERLEYMVNDSVHWRWINASGLDHPMHLHGFYFRVTGRSVDGAAQTVARDSQPLVVTELMPPGSTMDVSFLPTEPGNWVMHCHFASHVNGVVTLDSVYRDIERRHAYTVDSRHMAGLVMGLTVKSPTTTTHGAPSRAFRLLVGKKGTPFYFGSPGLSFVKHEGGPEPEAAAYRVPGTPLVLKRNERVAITIVNRLDDPTSVHWHGLEIESFPDGVPHWSGTHARMLPPVRPRDSLTVTFTPPRSGTFIYHSHLGEHAQINGGLYGAIVVVDDPAARDTTRDHLLVIGGGGVPTTALGVESPWGLVNGRRLPVLDLVAGVPHRLRLVSIHVDWRVQVTMDNDSVGMQWKPLAKDGADLPPALQRLQRVYWLAGPGETADFEFTPEKPGRHVLLVRSVEGAWQVPVTLNVHR